MPKVRKQDNPAYQIRKVILKKEGLRLIKGFDTNEHEPHKDVVQVEKLSRKLVLRIGEQRPDQIFSDGLNGKYFVLPKLVKTDSDPEPYEIEEYLPGQLISDIMPQPLAEQLYPPGIEEKLILAYWEFQGFALSLTKLKSTWSKKQDLLKYWQVAAGILDLGERQSAEEIIRQADMMGFWKPNFPCKWKFSADNLILMPDGRIGFIDLAKVSLRYWGYDLGWIFWSRWFHFADREYAKADGHFAYLQNIFNTVYRLAPETERAKQDFFKRCHLILFERIIGSLYDVGSQVSHAKRNIGEPQQQRAVKFVSFLKRLLVLNTEEFYMLQ